MEVLKSLKNRDKSDRQRKHGPLKKTEDSILINTSKLSRKRCFEKIKVIIATPSPDPPIKPEIPILR